MKSTSSLPVVLCFLVFLLAVFPCLLHAALKGVAIPYDYSSAVAKQPPYLYNCNDIALLRVAWTYNWGPYEYCANHPPPPSDSADAIPWPEFVPLIFDEEHVNGTLLLNATHSNEWLLGFNEPNMDSQGVTTPLRAAQLWPQLEATGRRLVSPAPATCEMSWVGCEYLAEDWLTLFFGNCSALYGAKGCRVDAIGIHFYPCAANDTIAGVEALYARFHKPIWVTEVACGGAGDPTVKRQQNEELLPLILPALDALPYVERYAWVAVRLPVGDFAQGGSCFQGSIKENNMTSVGHLLRNYSTPPPGSREVGEDTRAYAERR